MAFLWLDGFDEIPDTNEGAYLTSAGYIQQSGAGYTTGRGNTGRCLTLTGGGANLVKVLSGSVSEIFIGHGFKFDGTVTLQPILALFDSSTGAPVQGYTLNRNVNGGIDLWYGPTKIASTPNGVLSQSVWAYVEAHILLAGAASKVTIRVNNIEMVSAVTFTDISGTGIFERVTFLGAADGAQYYDDYYLLDSTGTLNTGLVGDLTVEDVGIVGNSAPIQFSPFGSVNNYSNINTIGAADDTSYNASATVGAEDRFTMAPVDVTANEVFAVQIGIRTEKVGSGAATIAPLLYDGAAEHLGPDISPDASFASAFQMFDAAPDGAAWSVPKLNACTVGYKITS